MSIADVALTSINDGSVSKVLGYLLLSNVGLHMSPSVQLPMINAYTSQFHTDSCVYAVHEMYDAHPAHGVHCVSKLTAAVCPNSPRLCVRTHRDCASELTAAVVRRAADSEVRGRPPSSGGRVQSRRSVLSGRILLRAAAQ